MAIKKDIRAATKKISKSINAAFKDFKDSGQAKKITLKIGKRAQKIVVRRTLTGFGVAKDGARKKKFPRLSDGYVAQRKGEVIFLTKDNELVSFTLKKKKKLSSKTSPSKSNLTFTGRLLESLRTTATKGGRFTIRPTGSRKTSKKNKIKNIELAKILEDELNRPFLHLSKAELRQLNNFQLEIYLKITGRLFKNL